MKKVIQKVMFFALIGVLSSVSASAKEYITNGDFEDGTFNGWTIENEGPGDWAINDGSFDPPEDEDPLPPISGKYDAVSWQHGFDHNVNLKIITKPITLPNRINSAILRWSDRIRNYAADFHGYDQGWWILIKDTDGNVLQEVFSTKEGDDLWEIEPNLAEYDLTSLAQAHEGEEIVISFEQQSFMPLNVTLDDVSMQIEQFQPPEQFQSPEHFTCYRVRPADQQQLKLKSLEDQFLHQKNVELIGPVEICAPADKNKEGVENWEHHLVCYNVRHSKERVNQLVEVKNQFGTQTLHVKGKTRRLCVPSTKKVIDDLPSYSKIQAIIK